MVLELVNQRIKMVIDGKKSKSSTFYLKKRDTKDEVIDMPNYQIKNDLMYFVLDI